MYTRRGIIILRNTFHSGRRSVFSCFRPARWVLLLLLLHLCEQLFFYRI